MLFEVMKSINNFFPVPDGTVEGTFTIDDGAIVLSFLKNGQYFLLEGSIFNDGLHEYGDDEEEWIDEEFEGRIIPLAIPKPFMELVEEIEEWQSHYGDAANSPYVSESFGGYSYNKGSDASASGWETMFNKKLRTWRKI